MISYIPLTFFGIIGAVGLAFFIHGFANRQKIFSAFNDLALKLDGAAGRSAIWSYPYLSGTYDGRPIKIFFHTSENHTVSVLNLVVEIGVSSRDRLLLLQKAGFRDPKPEQKAKLEAEVGPIVPVDGIPFDVHSLDSGRVKTLLHAPDLLTEIGSMTPYNQILLWEGSLIVSKQFEGVGETLSEAMMESLSRILSLAKRFEAHGDPSRIGAQTA